MFKFQLYNDYLRYNTHGAGVLRRYYSWGKRYSRWVTHSPTLDKHNAPPVLFTRKMFILTDSTNIYVLESISSRI